MLSSLDILVDMVQPSHTIKLFMMHQTSTLAMMSIYITIAYE